MFNAPPQSITDLGQCVGKDPSTFDDADDFTNPELSTSEISNLNDERRLRARVICAGCPVQLECLRWALESGMDTGTLGGMSSRQRRSMRSGRAGAGLGRGWRPQGAEPARRAHSQAGPMVRAFVDGASLLEVSERFGTSIRTVTEEARRSVV